MSWNYRVILKRHLPTAGCIEGEDELAIHEVYYEDRPRDDEIKAWSQDPIAAHGETLEELRDDLGRMLDALDKPILELSVLEKKITGMRD